MQQPPLPARTISAPTFYLTARQRLSPAAILLAIVAAFASLFLIVFAMAHSGNRRLASAASDAMRAAGVSSGSSSAGDDDDKDDPNQIDTIVLGDPSDAPVPARHGDHVSPVHPTLLVILPRSGDQLGLIPNSPAGHLLFNWLAAFNKPNYPALGDILPTAAPASVFDFQRQLRQHSGGFFLLSAKEIQPGLLVFRLRSQTPPEFEALGTLLMRPDSPAPAIASFSLRAIPNSGPPISPPRDEIPQQK